MTCGDDGRVVFVVKGGAAKVNEPHRGVVYSPLVALLKEDRKETRLLARYTLLGDKT